MIPMIHSRSFLFSGQKLSLFSFFIRFIASQWLTTLILKLGPRINCLCLTHGDRPKLNKHSYAKRVLITRQYTRSNIFFILSWLDFTVFFVFFGFSITQMNTLFIKMAWRKIMLLYVCFDIIHYHFFTIYVVNTTIFH